MDRHIGTSYCNIARVIMQTYTRNRSAAKKRVIKYVPECEVQ